MLTYFKGSRDPYVVTGNGAGFVMCWRNNVRWGIHQSDDPKKFMTVDSDDYVLAIPDYSHQARESSTAFGQDDESSSTSSNKNTTMFKKVIMKLSGNVRWLAGLVFERDLDQGGRSFHFKPHYEVTLRTPEHAKAPPGQACGPISNQVKFLTISRCMTLLEGFAVTISIYPSLLLHR